MGTLILNSSRRTILELLDGEISIRDFLKTTMTVRLPTSNHSTVCSKLRSYHQGDGGAPEVMEFEIVDATFDPRTKSGSVELEYVVYFYYGCDDMNSDSEQDQNWTFEVDPTNILVKFITEERLERDTLEEF